MTIDNEFSIGQTVYLKTDREQQPRMITGFRVRPGDLLIYDVSCGVSESMHYSIELTDEFDQLLTFTS